MRETQPRSNTTGLTASAARGRGQPTTADRNQLGLSLTEVLVALSLATILSLVAIPELSQARRSATLRAVAHRVGTLLTSCRAHAIFHHQNTAMVFERRDGGGWRCFLAEDLDGDGVRSDDLASGRDRIFSEIYDLEAGGSGLGILTTSPVPDPAGSGWLHGDDPVRAGPSDIISFTPRGTSTPASIYLTDHHSQMRALRVLGTTGRIRSLAWRVDWSEWKQTWW
jgi:hypothetical protein